MAWTRVAGTFATSSGSSVQTTAINAAGADLVVVCVADYDGNSLGSVTDTSSNSWGANSVTSNNATGSVRTTLWFLHKPSVSSSYRVTYTAAGGAFVTIGVEAWSGSATSPLDKTNSNTGNAVTTLACGNITPSATNELIFAAVGFGQAWATTPTINNGTVVVSQTYVNGTNFGLSFGYYNDPANSAINQTYTWTGTTDVSGIVASFLFGQALTGGGDLQLLLSDSIGWTPSLLGRPLPLLGAAAAGSAARLIRSGAKISRRALWTGRDH